MSEEMVRKLDALAVRTSPWLENARKKRNNMIDPKIGEIFDYEGTTLQCVALTEYQRMNPNPDSVDHDFCIGCFFQHSCLRGDLNLPLCDDVCRTDETHVIFLDVKEQHETRKINGGRMNTIIYRRDGMEVNGEFFSKSDIERKCGEAAVKDCREKTQTKKKDDETNYRSTQSSSSNDLMAHYTLMSTCTMNNF